MEGQGQAAEDQAGAEGEPLALFQVAVLEPEGAVDDHRGEDQGRGRAVDATQIEPGELDVLRVYLVDDEEQDQWDEIDELLHGGSQDTVETA